MVARTDVNWIDEMISHISRTHRHQVDGIVVFIDTAPLGPAYRDRPGVGTLGDLRSILSRLQGGGVVDDVRDLCYEPKTRKHLYQKYFGRDLRVTHNFRGYPVLGSLFSIDTVDAEYVLHFDSDMLIHTSPGSHWVRDGLELLTAHDEVMFVSPRSGPPREDQTLFQQGVDYDVKERYYAFKTFTSRKYLYSKSKFAQLLPISPQYISWKRRLWQAVTRKSALWNWEIMVSRALEESPFVRADLKSDDCWTLHTPDHGERFVKHLPEIVAKVEAGWFPEEQAGDFDLKLDTWI